MATQPPLQYPTKAQFSAWVQGDVEKTSAYSRLLQRFEEKVISPSEEKLFQTMMNLWNLRNDSSTRDPTAGIPKKAAPPTVVDLTASSPTHQDHVQDELTRAIDIATLPRLQIVLKTLCATSPTIVKEVSKLLLAPESKSSIQYYPSEGSSGESGEEDEEDEESEETDGDEDKESEDSGGQDAHPVLAPSTGNKRMRSRYVVCENCNEEFDVTENYQGDCIWHPGETEPDYESDFWADHDENCHGTIDSSFCREEYPDGFVWSCCDKLGSEEGCEITAHKEKGQDFKRARH